MTLSQSDIQDRARELVRLCKQPERYVELSCAGLLELRLQSGFQGPSHLFNSVDVSAGSPLIWDPWDEGCNPDSADHQRRRRGCEERADLILLGPPHTESLGLDSFWNWDEEYRLRAAAAGFDHRLLDPGLHRPSQLSRLMLAAIRSKQPGSLSYSIGLLIRELAFTDHYKSPFGKEWFYLETPLTLTLGKLGPGVLEEILDLSITLLELGAPLNSHVFVTLTQNPNVQLIKGTLFHGCHGDFDRLPSDALKIHISPSPLELSTGLMAAFSVAAKTLVRYILQRLRASKLPPESLARVENLKALIDKDVCKYNTLDMDMGTEPLIMRMWTVGPRHYITRKKLKEVAGARRREELQKHLLESMLGTKVEDRDEAMEKVHQLLESIFSESKPSSLITAAGVHSRVEMAGYICQGFKKVFDEDPSLWVGDRNVHA
ncbi:uncharacterized protein PgNI_00167 [Pyricularia grisea]|uniref:Uncharacterized protein n=1 Tax=Pyricularia grisea TaxID=148305 RepID=A0A6P8BJ09_PYRGI|nr:uncharacterized protein PgNI_00167 [Pyricularia grisea]TLD16778.1 hypothetical protein PgNI_00167 [Pyricularia grisea]